MRAETKSVVFFKAALLTGAAFLFSANCFCADGSVDKAIKEAESLSLVQDRLMACTVLSRNLKKTKGADAKRLRQKLITHSRFFYTDKGYQDYLNGKELLEKGKYGDSVEKFTEADELEKSNVDVLHFLALAQLASKKYALAEATATRGIQVCSIDIELQRDLLASQIAQEKWSSASKTAETLTRDFNDTSPQTLKERGLIAIKTDEAPEVGARWFESALKKDPRHTEAIYWLSTLKEAAESAKLLTKYVAICKTNPVAKNERETSLCSKLSEAEKKIQK